MKPTRIASLVAILFSLAAASTLAHEEAPGSKKEQLGRVLFKTSCTPEAQKQFERALGMLHSFFFPER